MEHSENLFASAEPRQKSTSGLPLAARMRPATLDEYVGQEELLGPGSPVRKAIEDGVLGSVILWAPPGCGKTTLALIIADRIHAYVESRSAVTTGVADVRKIAQAAEERRRLNHQPTLLVLDEIHHFTRTQQDALLGYLEDGTLQMVGVTTENPFFVLAPALLSRARVLPMKPLDDTHIEQLVRRALDDVERGLGGRRLTIGEEALQHLVKCANGDARLALNVLESASLLAPMAGVVEVALVEQVMQRPMVRYDQTGDYHYDTISAFIKSVRGSDSDAALHYLARMINAGEDPRFIMRRLLILASEDIGNAEPMGLVVATSAAEAVERVGMPEARLILAQATTFLAEAPKSNRSYMAIDAALKDVQNRPAAPIPLHLRNAPTQGLAELGHAKGYLYPHDFPGDWVEQRYLPEAELSTPYYEPSENGYEARIVERRKKRGGQKP